MQCRHVLIFGAMLLYALASSVGLSGASERPRVIIKHANSSTALQNCAAALRATVTQLGLANIKLDIDASDNDKPSGAALFTIRLDTGPEDRSAALIFLVPYLFQNPEHFGRFLKSDLYRELMAADNAQKGLRWLATAFGGSYNLFSRDHAMTERKHFYNRFVGGASHAALYAKIGGAPALTMIAPNWQRDIEGMAKKHRMVEGVELPLIDAESFGLARVSDVVNLTFSLPLTVFFYLDAAAPLPAASIRRIARWTEAAAATCSATNFEAERAALDKLKGEGKTVVPVNRPDFIETGWVWAMTEPYGGAFTPYYTAGWTVEDLDIVARMSDGPKPRRLPSAVLASLKPDQKSKYREKTKDVAAGRADRKQRAAATEAAETAWADGLMDIVDAVRQVDPRATKPRGELNSSRWMFDVAGAPESTVRFRLEDMDDFIAAGKLPDCNPNCHSLIRSYGGAAITLWKMGDQPAARRVFGLLERTALHHKDLGALMTLLQIRMSLTDNAGTKNLARSVAALVISPDTARVEQLIALAHVQKDLGDKEASARTLQQATEIAISRRARSDMIAAANAHAERGDVVAAWDLFAKAIETATVPSEIEWAITSFALRSDEVEAVALEVREKLARIETAPKAKPVRAAR